MIYDYTGEDPSILDPALLRALIRERAHHTIEIQLYDALAKGKPTAADIGSRVRELLSIWNERGFPTDGADLAWVNTMLEMAEQSKRGETVDLSPFAATPLREGERDVIRRAIRGRRSVRHWTDREVPDWMIDEILEAGLWAPQACHLGSLRFLVVREANEPGLFKGADIPGGPVHIVACQDRRVYGIQPGLVANPDRLETNRVLDCGAAMQNMLLAAYALGLGAVWLTLRPAIKERLRERFLLPEHIEIVTYLDVGFPAQTPMPPGRMSLAEVVLGRA